MEAAGVPRLLRVVNPHPPAGQADRRVNSHLRHVPAIRKYMFFSLGVVDLDPDIMFRILPLNNSCMRRLRYISPPLPSYLEMNYDLELFLFGQKFAEICTILCSSPFIF